MKQKDAGSAPRVDLLKRPGRNPVLLVDVLYAVVKNTALLDEIIDFFPEMKRKVFRKILDAPRRFESKGKAALQQLLDDPALDGKIDSALEQLMNSSTTSPESQA